MKQIVKKITSIVLSFTLVLSTSLQASLEKTRPATLTMSTVSMLTGTMAHYTQLEGKERELGISSITLSCMHDIAQIIVDGLQAYNQYEFGQKVQPSRSSTDLLLDILPRIAWVGHTGYELAKHLSDLLENKKDRQARRSLENNDIAQNIYVGLPLAVGASNLAQTLLQTDDTPALKPSLLAQHSQTVLRICQHLLKNHGSLEVQRYWFYALVCEMMLFCYHLGQSETISNENGPRRSNPYYNEEITFSKLGAQAGALRNLGNTCYMNSTLQLLRAIPELADTLPQEGGITEEIREVFEKGTLKLKRSELGNMFTLPAIMRNLVQALQNNQDTSLEIQLFHELLFKEIWGDKTRGGQHDSPELMQRIMQHEDIFEKLNELFGFELASHITCQASSSPHQHTSQTNDFATMLTLEIPEEIKIKQGDDKHKKQEKRKNQNLKYLLNSYQKQEWVCDDRNFYECPQCDRHVCFTKQLSLQNGPNNLLISIKRFNFGGRSSKDSTPISLPQELDLGGKKYEPVAIVQHGGDTGGGHYTALVKEGDKWYCCDDSSKTECTNIDTILDSGINGSFTPYLLLYRVKA